jgi:hypothetical protein
MREVVYVALLERCTLLLVVNKIFCWKMFLTLGELSSFIALFS